MDSGFEVLDHTADAGIVAHGPDAAGAFANAARGMFSLMVDLPTVRTTEERTVSVTAPDQEALLVAWLSELLYLFDTENLLFARFHVLSMDETSLQASACGEPVDERRHEIKTGIKAVSFHMLEIARENGTRARVVFDI